jgi:hypothetical protein
VALPVQGMLSRIFYRLSTLRTVYTLFRAFFAIQSSKIFSSNSKMLIETNLEKFQKVCVRDIVLVRFLKTKTVVSLIIVE